MRGPTRCTVAWVLGAIFFISGLALAAPAPGTGASHPPTGVPLGPPATLPAPHSVAADGRVVVAPALAPSARTYPVGAAPAERPLGVVVGLAPSNASGLAALVAAQYAPGAPAYRAFLTPRELQARFAPPRAAVTEATAYFENQGLSVSSSLGGLLLQVRGPSSDMGNAFGTSFEEYRAPSGRLFVSHPTPASLPGGIPWSGVYGLGNATPIVPASGVPTLVTPRSSPAASCASGPGGGLSPCEIDNAYSITPTLASANGTGERIGVVDAYSGAEPQSLLATDLALFDAATGVPSGTIRYLYPVPSSGDLNLSTVNPAWRVENALDLEWAHAIAPGAEIDMTFSPDSGPGLYAAVSSLVATHAVDVISLSWGEPDLGTYNAYSGPCSFACNATSDGSYATLGPVLEFAAAEGISVFAASGDCGASDGTSQFTTNFPASDPYVTGVGGTDLQTGVGGAWVSEVGWSGDSPGSSAPGCQNQGGSGGGYSPITRPWWQTGLPSSPSGRGVPDVAMNAQNPVSIIVGGGAALVSGTSVGTPIWAGIAAIADQKLGAHLGFLNPSLYRIAAGANRTANFHDIVQGSNGYAAGPGWDPVTGLGSPIVSSLIGNLSTNPFTMAGAPPVFLYGAPRFGPAPLNVSFALGVSGGSGTYPDEGVNFGDGNATLVHGTVSHVYPDPGVYSASAWVVDSSGNASVSPPIVVVVGGGIPLSVTLSASNMTPAVGQNVTFGASAAGANGSVRYSFTFGDGTYLENSSSPVVTHAYGAAGGFCAEVVVEDSGVPPNGGASLRAAVAVGGAPAPDCGNDTTPLAVTQNPGEVVRDAPADFPRLFDVSGGISGIGGLTYAVQYSGNNSYVNACDCTLLPRAGNYTVRAFVSDAVNQEAVGVANVTIAPPLVGAFAVSVRSGPAPLTVLFFSALYGGHLADRNLTQWQFGDGATAVGHAVSETYTSPGEYLAIGHASDPGHGNASEAFLIDVLPPAFPALIGLTATISPAVDVPSGSTLQFTGAVIGSEVGTTLGVGWTLGPGLAAFGAVANQSYYASDANLSSNQLSLTVSAILPDAVPVDSVSISLSPFFAIDPGGFVLQSSELQLHSAVGPVLGVTPLQVVGVGQMSGPAGPYITWLWGDGSRNSTSTSVHVYYAAGDYTVEAVARDAYGDRVIDSHAVVAEGPLQVLGGPSPPGGVPPLHVTFSVVGIGGSGPPYTYHWSFADGTTADGRVQTKNYTSYGRYAATVNVTDSAGKSVHRTWMVDVHPPVVITPAEILGLSAFVGGLIALVRFVRPRRPRSRLTLSQRRAAEAVRRVV